VSVPLPASNTFNFANVTRYSISMSNRGPRASGYGVPYLDQMRAVPPSIQHLPASIRGAMYEVIGVQGNRAHAGRAGLPAGAADGVPITLILPGPAGTPKSFIAPRACRR